MAAVIKFQLEAHSSYVQGEPVKIKFTLTNVSSQNLWVLKWYTPLEGIKGKIFQLVCDGEDVQYQGRMMKRGEPDQNDYVQLPAGGLVSAEVDLSAAYSLSSGRKCNLTFRGEIHDVIFGEQLTVRTSEEHHPMKISGNMVTFTIS